MMFATNVSRACAVRPHARPEGPTQRRTNVAVRPAGSMQRIASVAPPTWSMVTGTRKRVGTRCEAHPSTSTKNVDPSYDESSGSGSFDDDLEYPDLELSVDEKDIASQWPRALNKMGWKEKFEYVFVRVTLVAAGSFALLGVIASLMLSGLLFAMGMKEVAIHAVGAFMQNNAVGLVSAAVGALDRFLLGMVCLVFGLGTFELFLARSNREGEVRDRRLKKLAWLRVSSIDDLEQKVGEIIVAVMVVNLLEMSLHMQYAAPVDLVYAALAAFFSAGALAVLHWSSIKHGGAH